MLVSNSGVDDTEAAHIVPQSRPDVSVVRQVSDFADNMQIYDKILGESDGIFDVSAGILLPRSQHKKFDALKWSLYRKESRVTSIAVAWLI